MQIFFAKLVALFSGTSSFAEAEDLCKQHDMQLMTIDTWDEAMMVVYTLSSQGRQGNFKIPSRTILNS